MGEMLKVDVQLERARNVFNRNYSKYSLTEKSYLKTVFEKAATENVYKSIENDLSFLKFKERAFSNVNDISTKRFINHEKMLRQTSEIKDIESKIQENNQKIKEKEKALAGKTVNKKGQQNILGITSAIAAEIKQLKGTESKLVSDISSLKTLIQNIKSGNFSLSDIKSSMAGSAKALIPAGQKGDLKDLLSSSAIEKQVKKAQEEIEKQLKASIVAMLENILAGKESKLEQIREQISLKEELLDKNEKKAASLTDGISLSEKETIEEEIAKIIEETEKLIKERIKKDPQLVKFMAFQNFFNNILEGNGSKGSGLKSEIEEKSKDFSNIEEKYTAKLDQTNEYKKALETDKILKEQSEQRYLKIKNKKDNLNYIS